MSDKPKPKQVIADRDERIRELYEENIEKNITIERLRVDLHNALVMRDKYFIELQDLRRAIVRGQRG